MDLTLQDLARIGQYTVGMAATMVALGHVSAAGSTDYAASDGDPMCDFVLDMFLACVVGGEPNGATERIEAFVAEYDLVRTLAAAANL
jgi:hypothetical protein